MTLISSSIPNFVNGVSQQPFTLRLSSQGEAQVNGLSTVSTGLRKRPPTEHLAKISATPLTDAFVHMINRDGTEQYQVVVTNGDLKVYDLAGNAKTVNFTDKPYLNTAIAADQSFALTTVADYTFIVNKTKTVLADTTLVAARPREALIYVKAGNYGKTYTVSVNGVVKATYSTPDGSVATDSPKLATDYIALQLFNGMVASGLNTAPWSITQFGSVLYLKNTTTDFTISCEDGFGNNAMVTIKDKLQKFSDLPVNPRVDSFTVQIVGDQASAFDNYWVKFDAGGSNNTGGVWRETVQPGMSIGLNANTMPHQLVREADGTFTFKPATWTARLVGDANSNANPSFVGQTINDVFFFQNRLGFLSDENYFQTETGRYFNCFRTTVTTLLDSDPVDVNAATTKVAVLQHAVAFNKQLLLFSTQQQFLVDDNQLMSPKNVPIKATADFAVNVRAKPVACGHNVYFATDKGSWSAVREMFIEPNTATHDATDVSSHVPRYIPANIVKIAGGASEDVLALLSANDRTKLYIYKYYFSNNEKLQSSWSHFSFAAGGTILNCDFIKSALYLVISRSDGVYFEKMDFAVGAVGTGEPYQVMLDRKVQLDTSALSFDGTYTIINPAAIGYVPNDGTYMVVSKGGGAVKAGQLCTVIYSGGVTKVKGDYTVTGLTFGQKYCFSYTLSTLTVKTKTLSGGIQSNTEGRTQVGRIAFNHAETGFYEALVTPEARQTYTYRFGGKILGSPSAQIGVETLNTGRFNVPVQSQNTRVSIVLQSDMPLPVAILSADWEAQFVKRSQAV